jgi:hypothetical protein
MLGLLPDDIEVVVRERTTRVPDAIRQQLDRLKALYHGFHDRELARILFITGGPPIDHKTIKKLWQQSHVSCQGHLGLGSVLIWVPVPWYGALIYGKLGHYLGLWDYHGHPDPYQARLHVSTLSYHGWAKVSMSRFPKVSRPTVDAWIQRFEAEHFAGLINKSWVPKVPPQDLAPVDRAGVSPPESASRCREVPPLEFAGAARHLGVHDRPHHGTQQACL